MIYTSYFAKLKNIPDEMIPISIAGKAPTGYIGLAYTALAPKISFFREWKKNQDNNYYIEHFNQEVLELLNPHKVVSDLYKMSKGKDIVLSCYEKVGDFCHRNLVAEWLRSAGYEVVEWFPELKNEDHVVSVTGHRPNKLFGYDLSDPRNVLLKEEMKKFLVTKKCTKAVSGMALGVDQIFATAVIELKESGYPIELICAIPCKNHPCKWPKKSQEYYQWILNQSDKTVLVSDSEYNPWLMQIRNEYMVNISNEVLAIWDGSRGGTRNCVEFAKNVNKEITIINPNNMVEDFKLG
jgi:uncharacterized phage-like protein YoqJ